MYFIYEACHCSQFRNVVNKFYWDYKKNVPSRLDSLMDIVHILNEKFMQLMQIFTKDFSDITSRNIGGVKNVENKTINFHLISRNKDTCIYKRNKLVWYAWSSFSI